MSAWIIQPPPTLIEPAVAPEFFVDEIAAIEAVSGCIRLYLAANQLPIEAGAGGPNKIVCVKIVGPLSVPHSIAQLAQCLLSRPEVQPPSHGPFPKLVR